MHKIMKISDILPSPHNPRKPISAEDEEYQSIKRSIERLGYVEPLVVNSVNNHCVSGNNRLTVLKDIGFYEVECVVISENDENREIALTIALNRIKGRWDNELLEDLLNSLDSKLLEFTGFSPDELDRYLDKVSDEKSDLEYSYDDGYEYDVTDDKSESKSETSTTAKIGTYSIVIPTSEYNDMINDIRISKGFDDETIISELKRRLKQK